jgi:MFS family permease
MAAAASSSDATPRSKGVGMRLASPPGALVALLLLTALNLLNYIDRYVLPGVQPLIQKDFQLDDAQIGLLTTAFFIVYMFTAPLTGWLGDHYRRKPLIIGGALLWSAATLLTATVHTYHELLIRHAIVGIGEASFGIFAPAVLADFYDEIDRNRVLTIFYTAIPLGAALGYLTGGGLGARFGWRAPFYVAAVPGLIVAILLWIFLREPKRGASDHVTSNENEPAARGRQGGRGDFFRTLQRGLLRNPGYIFAVLGMALMTFSLGGISVWVPTFLVRYGNYSLGKAGLTLGVITAITGILGTFVGGMLAQRWLRTNFRALYLLSAWSMLLGIPGALLAFFGPHWVIVPSIFVAQFFLFLNSGPLNTAIVNSVSAAIRATAIAVELFLIHLLGDVPSPQIIGWVSDHTNLRIGLAVTLLAMLGSAASLFAGAKYAPQIVSEPAAPK